MKKERHAIISASYLILVKDDKVLLLRRYNTGYEDGNYSLIAGHVDKDESVLECAMREAKEEANIDINKEDLEVVHVMHRKATENNDERMDFFIRCSKWAGELKNMEPNKCDDLRWFLSDDLPENTLGYVKHALERERAGDFYSELGW